MENVLKKIPFFAPGGVLYYNLGWIPLILYASVVGVGIGDASGAA